jgi:DNA-binding response OmpR family regulator
VTTIPLRTANRVARRHRSATQPTSRPTTNPPLGILSISATREDHTTVRQSSAGMDCRVETAGSCHSAFESLGAGEISIVICERDLPDGSWRDVLERLGSAPERPFLIVTSRLADEWLWAEVLNLGGYDVLAKPFNASETRHVLETACLGRRGWKGHQRSAIAT